MGIIWCNLKWWIGQLWFEVLSVCQKSATLSEEILQDNNVNF